MRLKKSNPMNRALIGLLIMCDVICAGLAAIGAIIVDHRPVWLAILAGGGLAFLAILAVALFKRPIGWWLGWIVTVGMVALGFLTPMMFFLGGLFALLWVVMIILGKKIEAANPGKFD